MYKIYLSYTRICFVNIFAMSKKIHPYPKYFGQKRCLQQLEN